MIDELKDQGVTYWHFGKFPIFEPGIEGAHLTSVFTSTVTFLDSWPEYWKSAKVPISNPLVF